MTRGRRTNLNTDRDGDVDDARCRLALQENVCASAVPPERQPQRPQPPKKIQNIPRTNNNVGSVGVGIGYVCSVLNEYI